ncbi:MAG: phosphoenolpyruvate--protein phosphotransferase [Desulfobacteraceae bacterium]|nr:phosphoenolpyruvate--protein phosphotransferase [Desulfobacteraceae bacterium]
MTLPETNEIILQGISGSPGICIGKAYLVDKGGVDVVEQYHIEKSSIQNEVNRYKTAVNKAKAELQKIMEDTPDELKGHAHILETHIALLNDKMLYGKTIESIEKEQINAEWALKKVVSIVKPMFENMSDAYLRERADDIVQISDRVMKNLIGADRVDISDIDKRVILIARDLSPAETSQIQLESVKGFVTNRGGKASHTSIIARTLEIPAVLGVEKATATIRTDDIIIVDGTTGEVVVNPSEQTLIDAEERKARYEARKAVITRKSNLPAITTDGVKLRIMGNIELPEEVVSVMHYGGDGIGLYRTEFQYLSRPDFPGEDFLFEKYQDVVQVMGDKPVTIRTLDINGDKALAYNNDTEEENPALGQRGIRYCLRKPEIFKTQLRAILRAAVFGTVRVMFPMISSVEEVLEARKLLEAAKTSLKKDAIPYKDDIQVGIMVEVPSAVVTADLIAKEVDFFSIGTNDLIQYALAIDRTNRDVAHLYHPLHPAIIRMIKHVCDVARKAGIKTFMCGEMAGDPINIPILLGLGLDELSMNPQSIPAAKAMIRALDSQQVKPFIDDMLRRNTAAGIVKLINDTYGKLITETVYNE